MAFQINNHCERRTFSSQGFFKPRTINTVHVGKMVSIVAYLETLIITTSKYWHLSDMWSGPFPVQQVALLRVNCSVISFAFNRIQRKPFS
jgi:hypothetical protein